MRSITAGDETSMRWNETRRSGCAACGCEVRERAGGEIVDRVDAPTFGEQPIDERGADEAPRPVTIAFITGATLLAAN